MVPVGVPDAMLRRLMSSSWSRLFAGSTMLHVAGVHWVLLQVLAWTGMMAVYVPESGWREGLANTFSGEKPCSLCCAISEGRESEKEESPLLPCESKREVYPPSDVTFIDHRTFSSGCRLPLAVAAFGQPPSWTTTPEPPPPRRGLDLRFI